MDAPIYGVLKERLDDIVRENKKKDTENGAIWHRFVESSEFNAAWFDKRLLRQVEKLSRKHNCSYMCAMVSMFEWLMEMKDHI